MARRKTTTTEQPTADQQIADNIIADINETIEQINATEIPVVDESTGEVPVVVESAGDSKVATTPVVIDETKPWALWPQPEVLNVKLEVLNMGAEGEQFVLSTEDSGRLGKVTDNALRELGWRAGFDAGFVREKVSREVGTIVVNERIRRTAEKREDREVALLLEGDTITNFMPGWREALPFADVAQITHDILGGVYGANDLLIDDARCNEGQMNLRLITPIAQEVTRHKGDVLQLGVEIHHDYGRHIEMALYAKRLVCLNGMTADNREFSWKQRSSGTKDHQAAWLRQGLGEVVSAYDNLLARARRMASATFEGDYRSVLREHARAMGLPGRHFNALVEAYEAELGLNGGEHNEWTILNAFTRLATHGGLSRNNARQLQAASGRWTTEFEMVNARLPRPMATLVGAQIVEA